MNNPFVCTCGVRMTRIVSDDEGNWFMCYPCQATKYVRKLRMREEVRDMGVTKFTVKGSEPEATPTTLSLEPGDGSAIGVYAQLGYTKKKLGYIDGVGFHLNDGAANVGIACCGSYNEVRVFDGAGVQLNRR